MCRMNKPCFLAYDDDLRRFYTVVSFQIENTPLCDWALCGLHFFTSPFSCCEKRFSFTSVGESVKMIL